MAERVLLVVNPEAGSFDDAFRASCEKAAPEAKIGTIDDLPKEPWDVVVACGGDGTVRLVVNALVKAESEAALGIVPLGTANVIARALGLPKEPEEALGIAVGTEERRIDVGICHGEAFLLGCGLGLAERFVTTVGHDEKAKLGPIAYLKKLLEERKSPPVEFQVEGPKSTMTLAGVGLIVANMAQLGPSVRPMKEVSPEDGRLALILIRHAGLLDMVRLGLRGLFGHAEKDSALDLIPIEQCRISSRPKVPIQIDGDAVEQEAPFEFSVLPSWLRVRVPQA